MIATDNASTDGTTEILERYERAGRPAADPRAGRRHAPGRVGHADGAARGDRARRRLGDPLGCGRVLVAARRHAEGRPRDACPPATASSVAAGATSCPRPDDGAFFAERMTVRLATPAHPGDKETIFHAHQKVAHRAHRRTSRSKRGNHNAEAPGLDPLRAWHPIEVLHFSFRSVAQVERKARGGWLRNPDVRADPAPAPARRGVSATAGSRAFYAAHAVDDEALARRPGGRHARDRHPRCATRCVRLRDDGRDVRRCPARAADSRSPGRPPRRTRRTRPRRPCSSRSTASSAPSSACARSSERLDALEAGRAPVSS